MDTKALARRIHISKIESKLTNKEIAQKAGISMRYMQQVQLDRVPSLRSFVEICNSLEVCPNYLLQDSLNLSKKINDIIDCLKMLNSDDLEYIKSSAKLLAEKRKKALFY